MDFKSMQALFWLLLFVFLIFVPGSTLDAIESKEKPAAAITAEIAKTIRTTTTAAVVAAAATTKAPSLLKDTVNDKTFLKFQSSTQATRRNDVPEITAATTTTSTSTKETTAITTKSPTFISTRATEEAASAAPVSLVRKATNVNFSIGTKASLNSSKSREDSDPTATTIITTATRTAAEVVELSTTVDAVTASTSTEQVTIAAEVEEVGEVAQLMATLTPITANNDKALNNADNRIINDNKNNSTNHYYDTSLSISNGKNNKNTQVDNSKQSPMKLLPRPLQKPKIYHDNRSEQQLQQHVWVHEQQKQQLQQQQYQAAHFKQQYTRQVQQALTMTTTITALSSGTAAALDSNLIVADKNIEENELQTEDKSNLKTASMPYETNDAVAAATTTTTTTSTVALTTKPSASTTATESTTTTRRRSMATTTLRPTPAIDDYQTITSQAGTHAYLPCNVKQLVKKPISWLRVRDGHILTVDQTTFIADQRFQSIYTSNPERWSLQIKYVQLKDAGTYECQVSTEPKASAIVSLRIVEPKTELIGESTRHVKAGSQVKLRCIISQALEPPLFINWFYNQKQIYLHNRKGWRTEIERIDLPQEMPLTTTKATTTTTTIAMTPKLATGSDTATTGQRSSPYAFSMSSILSSANDGSAESVPSISAAKATTAIPSSTTSASSSSITSTTMAAAAADVKQITTASLIIPAVEKLDSGNYTCSPSNSAPRTVVLHVLNGEYSASAITSGVSGNINIGHRSQQWHFHWHNAPTTAATTTTILTLLWIIKFLFAKNIWDCNSHTSSTRRVRNNCHRNNRNSIQAETQFAADSTTKSSRNSTHNITMELREKT